MPGHVPFYQPKKAAKESAATPKATVYSIASGEAIELDWVDARERIATGEWAWAPPSSSVHP